MKAYYFKLTETLNNKYEHREGYLILLEEKPEEVEREITWSNLEDYLKERQIITGCRLSYCKKGRELTFYYDNIWMSQARRVREKDNFKIISKIEYIEDNPTIEELLSYRDGEKAIKYIAERGLEVVKAD